MSVLLNTGDGRFGPNADYRTDIYPNDVAIGDFNGDGNLDVVTANLNGYTVSVLRGPGDGRLAAKVDLPTVNTRWVAVRDVNADGKLDIVTDGPSVLAGRGDGTFAAHVDYLAGYDTYNFILADVTGDGRPDDLLVGNTDTVTLLPGTSNGFGAAPLVYATGAGPGTLWLAAGDLDGDGRIDLVFPSGNTVVALLNTCP